jgi:hypothetical protein
MARRFTLYLSRRHSPHQGMSSGYETRRFSTKVHLRVLYLTCVKNCACNLKVVLNQHKSCKFINIFEQWCDNADVAFKYQENVL